MFIVAFAQFCVLEKNNEMLSYGVIYLGCWSIFAHATSRATETVKNNLTNWKIELSPTNSLDVANEMSYQPKIQVSIPFFTPRFVRGEDVQLREQLEDMRKEVRGLSSRLQKLEGQDGRTETETTSNETVVDACRCNGKLNQSDIVGGASSESNAAEMTKLLRSIESSMHEFRSSLDLVQKDMNFVNQSSKEITNNITAPGVEQITALPYWHGHNDVPVFINDKLPIDCWDAYKSGYNVSGVYKIKPSPMNAAAFFVYCQMDVHGGGWTVFQNRYDGQVNFYQDWKHYKSGFGNLAAEFWLGLDHIHELTNSKESELLIELEDFESLTRFATYDNFLVDSEEKKYQISLLGAYKGNAGDSFSYHSGKSFSTWDMDNDDGRSTNCAADHIGAWWFGFCTNSYLNGPYSEEKPAIAQSKNGGIYWSDWKGYYYSLKKSRMSIRPRGAAVAEETN